MPTKTESQAKETLNAKAKTKELKKKSNKELVNDMVPAFKMALPNIEMSAERFTRISLTALSKEPKLNECTPESLLGALMQACQLGVEPNTNMGQAYLLPYWNNRKKKYECQFQLSYKGLLELAYRTEKYQYIDAQIVYENDEFYYEYGLNKDLKHVPTMGNRGKPIAVYGIYKLNNGGFNFEVMSIKQVQEFARDYSKSFNNGPWRDNFEAMAKKTLIKKVLKYAPLSAEARQAMNADQTVKSISLDIQENLDVLNTVEDEVEYEVENFVNPETGEVNQGQESMI